MYGSPPFIKFSEKYKWNVRTVRGTMGSGKFEVAELINLPFEEKTVILYKNKKTSIIHQFKYKVKKSINRRGEK